MAGLRPQLRATITQSAWAQAKNVTVFRVPSHTSFSDRVAEHYLRAAAEGEEQTSGTPAVLAVCAYPPYFFMDAAVRILEERIHQRGTSKTIDHVDGDAVERLLDFRRCSAPEVEERLLAEGAALESLYLRAADFAFPHFRGLRNERNVVRLCCFTTTKVEADPGLTIFPHHNEYLDDFRSENSPADVYAFFNWLNKKQHCFVIPPYKWAEWGMSRPRDFAVFNNHFLVEYHPNVQLCIQARFGQKGWVWPFADVDSLRRRLEDRTIRWSPDQFWQTLYNVEPQTMDQARVEASAALQTLRLKWAAFRDQSATLIIDNLHGSMQTWTDQQRLNKVASVAQAAVRTVDPSDRETAKNKLRELTRGA